MAYPSVWVFWAVCALIVWCSAVYSLRVSINDGHYALAHVFRRHFVGDLILL
jgi:hypothetical protein